MPRRSTLMDQRVLRITAISAALDKGDPHQLVGIVTRGDLLSAHARRLREACHSGRHLRFGKSSRQPA